jgi:hypothetical protein
LETEADNDADHKESYAAFEDAESAHGHARRVVEYENDEDVEDGDCTACYKRDFQEDVESYGRADNLYLISLGLL